MKNLSGKRLLLLGGSYCKDAIKQFATENNVRLIAAGNNPNAGINSIVDEYYNVNSTDSETVKKLISDKNIDGVYLGSSEPVINSAVSYVPECGFPCYCTKEQWETIQNKGKLKELFIKFGLPVVPRYNITEKNLNEILDNMNFPVITKPIDGCASNGFSICYNIDDLKRGYSIAKSYSASGEVLVEKFVNNQGIVAFFSFSKGKMYFLGIEDKFPRIYQKGGGYVAGLLVFESKCTEEFSDKFSKKLEKMFNSLGLKEGTVWIEVFRDGENYYFNEAGYRYGGSVTVYPIDYLYGVNQVYADMYYALTGESEIHGHSPLLSLRTPKKRHYGIYPIYIKAGFIKSVLGLQDVERLDNIAKIITTKHVGEVIDSTGGFSQNFALIHFVFDTYTELRTTIENIHENLKILDENGDNLVVDAFIPNSKAIYLDD